MLHSGTLVHSVPACGGDTAGLASAPLGVFRPVDKGQTKIRLKHQLNP